MAFEVRLCTAGVVDTNNNFIFSDFAISLAVRPCLFLHNITVKQFLYNNTASKKHSTEKMTNKDPLQGPFRYTYVLQ